MMDLPYTGQEFLLSLFHVTKAIACFACGLLEALRALE